MFLLLQGSVGFEKEKKKLQGIHISRQHQALQMINHVIRLPHLPQPEQLEQSDNYETRMSPGE